MAYQSKYKRPYRDAGIFYRPKHDKPEMRIQLAHCADVRKRFPHLLFHSDYAAGLDLTMHQAKTNKALQSDDKFIDWCLFAPSVPLNPKTGKPYIGLALEIKADGTTVILKIGTNKGKLTSDPHIRGQARTLRKLADQGWYANFAVGLDQCTAITNWYLGVDNSTLF